MADAAALAAAEGLADAPALVAAEGLAAAELATGATLGAADPPQPANSATAATQIETRLIVTPIL
ncbi:MAG TPA: hypothetical protein VIR57_09170 [Chloroflexota bacterium]